MANRTKAPAVFKTRLEGNCLHGISAISCEPCRATELRRAKAIAARPKFVGMVGQNEGLDNQVVTAIQYAAAVAIQERKPGFLLTDVLDLVFTLQKLNAFTKAMFGANSPHLQEAARQHVLSRIRSKIKVREPDSNVRVYVCWRVPGMRPRMWGVLHTLGIQQLSLVARDYGILGDGIAFSKDATLFLCELMEKRGPRSIVADVWQEAAPEIASWRSA